MHLLGKIIITFIILYYGSYLVYFEEGNIIESIGTCFIIGLLLVWLWV